MKEEIVIHKTPIEFTDIMQWLGLVLFFLCLIGGYLLSQETTDEPDVKKEYERMKKVYHHTGHIGQNFTKDTTYKIIYPPTKFPMLEN